MPRAFHRAVSICCAVVATTMIFLPQRAQSQSYRLEEQSVSGTWRNCAYRYLNRQRNLRVGRGEPCPATYRRPVPVGETVPAFATLQGRVVQQGRAICLYTFQQRIYRQAGSASGYCPYTPVAAPR